MQRGHFLVQTDTQTVPVAAVMDRAARVREASAGIQRVERDTDCTVRVRQLDKHYRTDHGAVHAVRSVSFEVPRGALVTLLGPSGCGKTTILRSIAGLESPESGEIILHGDTVFSSRQGINRSPAQRRIGMVFQSYAIWPHMTVYENVAYPLRMQRVPRAEEKQRTLEVLELVGLGHAAQRSATALSGGQQQRVAVARAIVSQPELLLFDEPLSNLDARLRKELRQEIRDVQRRLGLSALYVTHDQEEAMAISDIVIVLDQGVIVDEGGPADVYQRPGSLFSANFMGDGNFFDGTVVALQETLVRVQTSLGDLIVRQPETAASLALDEPVTLLARPEYLQLYPADTVVPGNTPSSVLPGIVRSSTFLGPFTEHQIVLENDQVVTVRTLGFSHWEPDQPAQLVIQAEQLVVFQHPEQAEA
jgi:iron(III) transport system ATP-binding protein